MDFKQSILISLSIVLHLSIPSVSRDNFLQQLPKTHYNTYESRGYPASGKPEVGFGIHKLDPNYDDGSSLSHHKPRTSTDESKIPRLESSMHRNSESALDQHSQSAPSMKAQTNLPQTLKSSDVDQDRGSNSLEKKRYGRKDLTGLTPWIGLDTDESELDKIDSEGYIRRIAVSFKRLIWQHLFLQDRMQYYVLALQWPASVCNTQQCRSETVKMVEDNNEFKIHGLWPTRWDQTPPDCTQGPFENITDPLKGRLEQAWPSYYNLDNQGFWEYEWNTHGRCSDLRQTLYFDAALDLHEKYDIAEYLYEGDIKPGGSYETDAIRRAIANKFSGDFRLTCRIHGRGIQLQEVRLCVLPNYRPCLGTIPEDTPCQGLIQFPKFLLAGSTT